MSATDSDNSIDWLGSDYEDNESEQEFDSCRKYSQAETPVSPTTQPHPVPSDGSCQVRDCDSNWSEVREASGRGSSPGCTETWDNSDGLCKRQGDKTTPQQALKRPCSSIEEEERKERQLLSNASEKNQIFSQKVSRSFTHVFFLTVMVDSITRACPITSASLLLVYTMSHHVTFPVKMAVPIFIEAELVILLRRARVI